MGQGQGAVAAVSVWLERALDHVGRERFDAACDWARRTAEGTGRHTPEQAEAARWPADLADVPHELTELLWPAPVDDPLEGADDVTRQRVIIAAYRRMPCYALLMMLPAQRDAEVVADYGAAIRALLEEADPRLADPVSYHLWCGDFEAGAERGSAAWSLATDGVLWALGADGVTTTTGPARRLSRVLQASGPVPWAVKHDLLAQLVASSHWRAAVFAALDSARDEINGELDEHEARSWGWPG